MYFGEFGLEFLEYILADLLAISPVHGGIVVAGCLHDGVLGDLVDGVFVIEGCFLVHLAEFILFELVLHRQLEEDGETVEGSAGQGRVAEGQLVSGVLHKVTSHAREVTPPFVHFVEVAGLAPGRTLDGVVLRLYRVEGEA